jgi:Rhodanese-like domain
MQFSAPLGRFLNVALFISAVSAAWSVGQRFTPGSWLAASPSANSQIHLSKLSLPDVDQTVVIFLSASCPWCKLSVPLYRALLDHAQPNTQFVAVFRKTEEGGREFLDSHGLGKIKSVETVDYGGVGVNATPTMLIVGKHRHLKRVWEGVLSSNEEQEDLFKTLGINKPEKYLREVAAATVSPSPANEVASDRILGVESFRQYLTSHPSAEIIDLRDRELYQQGHLRGAINLPLDEFEMRGRHEIPSGHPLLLYCGYRAACETRLATRGVPSFCSVGIAITDQAGFKESRVLGDDPATLRARGDWYEGPGSGTRE